VTDSPWSSRSTRSRAAGVPRQRRLIEIVTVLLLGVATVGSAWSAFQVSRWNGVETDDAREAASSRIDGSREYALATQIVAYDAAAVSQYASAVAVQNEKLQAFLRDTIIRPGFRPVFDSWLVQVDAGETPTNLLEDPDYLGPLFAEADAADARAEEASARGEEARSNADDYIQLTLFFASALFFAGITSSFNTRFAKLVLLGLATGVLSVAGVLLAGYPIA